MGQILGVVQIHLFAVLFALDCLEIAQPFTGLATARRWRLLTNLYATDLI